MKFVNTNGGHANLSHILTCRKIDSSFFWQIVFEWEDIFAKELGIPLWNEPAIARNPHAFRLPILGDLVTLGKGNVFRYDLSSGNYDFWNTKRVIPCIIDFITSKERLPEFEHAYRKHKLVLISSLEAYSMLKEQGSKLNIAHLPLSLSDKYRITASTKIEKKYDLVLMGRQNPVLMEFVQIYAQRHPDFVYVYRPESEKGFAYYTTKGEFVGDIVDREQYMQLTRQARCSLYSTQCVDGGPSWRSGYNQVTPRFLEMIASGCHIIARYKENPDTDFYEIDQFAPMCDSYSDFERQMDQARNEDVDMAKHAKYMEKHYTSVRAGQLREILKTIE